MPAHWYYCTADIYRDFPGGVHDLQPAPAIHPSSIMSLHSTRQGGRSSQAGKGLEKEVVGDLILKGKRQFWNVSNMHYHHGMQAGDITLNAHCARVVMRCVIRNDGHYDKHQFLADYIDFMTADPPLHNDTYAESWHRGFFANLQRGLPPAQCAALTHDTASIGGLVSIGPLAVASFLRGNSLAQTQNICRVHLNLSHPDPGLTLIWNSFVNLIGQLMYRTEQQDVLPILSTIAKQSAGMDLQSLLAQNPDDTEVLGKRYSIACYIDGAWPSVLYLAAKYASDPKSGLIANTNAGGDNVHRGFVLGILAGLISASVPDDWYHRLTCKTGLDAEIEALLALNAGLR